MVQFVVIGGFLGSGKTTAILRPAPPPLEQASPEARQRLRGIGQHALANVALDARQKKAVEDTLKRLDDLDKGPQPVPKEGAEQDDECQAFCRGAGPAARFTNNKHLRRRRNMTRLRT